MVGGLKIVVGLFFVVLILWGFIFGVIKLLDVEYKKGKVVDMN